MKWTAVFLPLLFLFSSLAAFSQDTIRVQDTTHADLYNRFLNEPGDIDSKLTELKSLADKDYSNGRMLEAIQKIQTGLVLEKQQSRPTKATLSFNVFAGDMIRGIDKGYSLEFYKKAIHILHQLPKVNPSEMFYIYTNRAGIHADLKEFDDAKYWYQKAVEAAMLDNPVSIASAYNNLGVYFNKTHHEDSAQYYLSKSLELLETHPLNIPLYCAAKDNLAEIAIARKQYDVALKTFQFNDSVYFKTKESYHKYVPNKLRLLNMMERLNMPGIADTIRHLQAFVDTFPLRILPIDIRYFYRFADNYFFANHLWKKQAEYHERFTTFADSMDLAKENQVHALTKSLFSVQEISFKNEIRYHQLEAEQTKLKLKSTERIFFIFSLSIVSIGSLLILYFRKRRQELQAQKQIAESALIQKELEARLVRQDLELKKRDLTNVVLHNTQVYDHNQKMIDRLHTIRSNEDQVREQLRSLVLEMQNQNRVGDHSMTMLQQIETVNAAFFDKLKNKFPGLSKTEAELCGYIRINLSSKDISVLKNIETSSVKMGKNRLRKN